MMRRRSSSSNSSVAPAAGRWVGRAQRVSRRRGVGGGEAQWATVSLGSPPATMVPMLPGAQVSLFSSMA